MLNFKKRLFGLFFIIGLITLNYLGIYFKFDNKNIKKLNQSRTCNKSSNDPTGPTETIHIVNIFCGLDNVNIANFQAHFNSIILMSQSNVHLHLITDADNVKNWIENKYAQLPEKVKNRVKIVYYPEWFPNADWKPMYKPCASERLFLTEIINKDVDRVIFLDLDTLVLGKLEKIWKIFDQFGPQHIMAATIDCPFYDCAYAIKARGKIGPIPIVWNSGLNAGVLFMRLDKMRQWNYMSKMIQIASEYKAKIEFADMDILNILFANGTNVDYLKNVDCSYNYVPHFCRDESQCDRSDGIKISHGCANWYQPGTFFHSVKTSLAQLDFSKSQCDLVLELLYQLDDYNGNDNCKNAQEHLFNGVIQEN